MMMRSRYYLKYNSQNLKPIENEKENSLLTIIVAIVIMEECYEINWFFRAMIQSNDYTILLTGSTIGIILGILASISFYKLLIWLFNKNILIASSFLLMFVAASRATSIPDLLTSTNLISFSNQSLWNSSSFLSEESIFGGIAKNIFGYKSNPTLVHFISYLSVLSIGLMINLNIIRAKDKN
jgi:high-affinity iron transporter